jgi:peptidoglycan-associated lipoprotein
MPRMSGFVSMAALLAAVVLVAGCKTAPVKKNEAPPPATAPSNAGTSSAPSTNVGAGQQLSPEQLARQALEKIGYVIYFDYDKADIKSESAALITAHAKYLSSNPSLKARLEGSTDERGSREYNIGLGERRAQAVRQALMLQGVSDSQLTTLSYGEERPAVDGHDETAYAKNRRVEIAY